jgi:hypothetical protein
MYFIEKASSESQTMKNLSRTRAGILLGPKDENP